MNCLIIAAGHGSRLRAVSPSKPLTPVAGVPLLLRTILALQRAGVERLTLVGDATVPADPRIRLQVGTAPSLAPTEDERLRLIVGAGTVIDEALVRELGRHARPGEVLEVDAFPGEEGDAGPSELVVHHGVPHVALEPSGGVDPDLADDVRLGVDRPDASAELAPELVVVDLVGS